MVNKIFLLGLFLLSVANVKAQTQTQNDSLIMENMMHNLPEIMVKGSRPIVKAERGMLSYNMGAPDKPCGRAVQMLTQKHVAKRYMIAKKVVPLHYESEWQYKYV